jgi:hypothetical protein
MSKYTAEETRRIIEQAKEFANSPRTRVELSHEERADNILRRQASEPGGLVYKTRDNAMDTTSSRDDVSPRGEVSTRSWLDVVDERLDVRMRAMLEAAGEFIGDALDEERKAARDELAHEVKKLWSVLTELQMTMREFGRIERATKALEAMPVEHRRAN